MENASKALLIAAAVLIVILLIAFGMNIFNSAQDVGDASGASSAINTAVTGTSNKLQGLVPGEAREFNKQIESCIVEGTYQGSEVAVAKYREIKAIETKYGRSIVCKTDPDTGWVWSKDKDYKIEIDSYGSDRIY